MWWTIIQLGVVHKLRLQDEVGRWSKNSTFCQHSYHRRCKRRGVGGQKKPKSCQSSLWTTPYHNKFFLEVMCHDSNLIRNWVDCNFRNLDLYYHYCCHYDIQMSWGCCPIGFLCNRVGWSILCFLLYLEKRSVIKFYT